MIAEYFKKCYLCIFIKFHNIIKAVINDKCRKNTALDKSF